MLDVKRFNERREEVEQGNFGNAFEELKDGPHACVITKATDYPNDSYTEFELEIAGKNDPQNGYYKKINRPCKWRRYYTPNAEGFYIKFCLAVESCNKGYNYDGKSESFVGKHVIVNFRKYERVSKAGNTYTIALPEEVVTLEDYQAGKAKALPVVTLAEQEKRKGKTAEASKPVSKTITEEDVADEDLPF